MTPDEFFTLMDEKRTRNWHMVDAGNGNIIEVFDPIMFTEEEISAICHLVSYQCKVIDRLLMEKYEERSHGLHY